MINFKEYLLKANDNFIKKLEKINREVDPFLKNDLITKYLNSIIIFKTLVEDKYKLEYLKFYYDSGFEQFIEDCSNVHSAIIDKIIYNFDKNSKKTTIFDLETKQSFSVDILDSLKILSHLKITEKSEFYYLSLSILSDNFVFSIINTSYAILGDEIFNKTKR